MIYLSLSFHDLSELNSIIAGRLRFGHLWGDRVSHDPLHSHSIRGRRVGIAARSAGVFQFLSSLERETFLRLLRLTTDERESGTGLRKVTLQADSVGLQK